MSTSSCPEREGRVCVAGIAGGAGDAQGAAVGPRAWDLGRSGGEMVSHY